MFKIPVSAIGSAALFATTLFLFVPFSIYLTNAIEFSITSEDLAFVGIALAVLTSLVLWLGFAALNAAGSSALEKGTSLVFAAGFLLWLQGNFLLWRYGPLDGGEIPWRAMERFGYLDGTVWIVVLAAAFVFSSAVFKIAGKAAFLLMIVQLIFGAYLFVGQQETPSFKRYSVDTAGQFLFSRRTNVIVIVLDSFQTDAFSEIIRNSPDIAKLFNGFTHFRNSLSGYTFTELSIALMLTGKFYDNSQPFERWKQAAYELASIPRVLKAEGWRIDLIPKVSYSLYYSENIASNFIRGRPLAERMMDLAAVYDLSLFRCLPHFFKRVIYNRQDWTIQRLFVRSPRAAPKLKDGAPRWIRPGRRPALRNPKLFSSASFRRNQNVRFIDAMLADSRVADLPGAFKFYHVGGPHAPLNLNENLRFEEMVVNRPNYIRAAIASLKLMGMFLDHLQDLGIYDNSLIFIVGDHGAGHQGQRFILQPGMPVEEDGSDIVTQSSRVAALPLILVKPLASRGELKISDQPVSLGDIPATVFSEIGLETGIPGQSMFEIDVTRTRERRVLFYSGRDIYSYYGEMSEFIVSGYGWQDRAWRHSGRVFTKNGILELRRDKYAYGSVISLRSGGNAIPYLEYGWGKAGKESTWTEGARSLLVVPVDPPSSDLRLQMSLRPRPDLLRRENLSREIIVTVNGVRLGSWVIESPAYYTYSMPIPQALVQDGLRIHLEIPGATSVPEDKGREDKNIIGVAIREIVVRQ